MAGRILDDRAPPGTVAYYLPHVERWKAVLLAMGQRLCFNDGCSAPSCSIAQFCSRRCMREYWTARDLAEGLPGDAGGPAVKKTRAKTLAVRELEVECAALLAVYRALEPLSHMQRVRVIRYIQDRFGCG